MLLDNKFDKSVKLRTYKLLAAHQQSNKSTRYVDAEFKAGWIAYTYLNKPELAAKHFSNSAKRSFSRKHKSRIYYWQGQLARKNGNHTLYNKYMQKAANFKFSFYGQLAGERIGQKRINIPKAPSENKQYLAQIHNNVHSDFIKLYNYLGQKHQLKYHYAKLRRNIKTSEKMVSLVKFALSQNNMHHAMDSARKGMIKGLPLQSSAYPKIGLPNYKVYTGQVEKALSFGLIRQESLFDQYATSSSGARGFMQIMPNTGKYLAKKYKVDYKLSWLHSKPELNLALGNSYIYDLVQNFEGSIVMAIAAYNAGGTWVKRWNKANGDPRVGQVRFVNWIEAIPKAETRNYVKKVTKNMQVYRVRFGGSNITTNLISTLITGEK